ncbi:MAG: CDP-alcohol phosphatidyltransferase family protein [Deltaproteobacteria bacterium]|nr:CDP-alcohol phosphatidyltransferase family protein [Deltaproteobacteria bacterium]MBW2086389.1 CDP-alcohol phosphatidyltransferase family protein [Deltaproteobacteria bacterium]
MIDSPETSSAWQTKPTDRFILKWIKCHLSARITPHLVHLSWLQPWMITVCAAILGTLGGVIFALGWAWLAGLLAAASQILDGVDGQFARLTDRQSSAGAYLDSVLDRYAEGSMIIGLTIYLVRLPLEWPLWLLLILGALAVIGSNLGSYAAARAESLDLDLGRHSLASKGTRSMVMILCAWGTLLWPPLPLVALIYLAVHPNAVEIAQMLRVYRKYS